MKNHHLLSIAVFFYADAVSPSSLSEQFGPADPETSDHLASIPDHTGCRYAPYDRHQQKKHSNAGQTYEPA